MQDEILIQSIIDRYGDVINLRETPYLIVEIMRTHGSFVFDEIPDAGVSVAGVGTPPAPPPPPSPGPASGGFSSIGNVVDNAELMKEILKLNRQVATLTEEVRKLSSR